MIRDCCHERTRAQTRSPNMHSLHSIIQTCFPRAGPSTSINPVDLRSQPVTHYILRGDGIGENAGLIVDGVDGVARWILATDSVVSSSFRFIPRACSSRNSNPCWVLTATSCTKLSMRAPCWWSMTICLVRSSSPKSFPTEATETMCFASTTQPLA